MVSICSAPNGKGLVGVLWIAQVKFPHVTCLGSIECVSPVEKAADASKCWLNSLWSIADKRLS